jgi:tRNA threonylcarbamoyladenosine biosynthesis protein TsaB
MILSLRTDKPESEVGLFDDDGKRVKYEKWLAHRHLAETIHAKIDELLKANGTTADELKGLIVYQGPGSFTGLRIGISVANAMAYSLSIPITAATGRDWQQQAVANLDKSDMDKWVKPLYGHPANITTPKK